MGKIAVGGCSIRHQALSQHHNMQQTWLELRRTRFIIAIQQTYRSLVGIRDVQFHSIDLRYIKFCSMNLFFIPIPFFAKKVETWKVRKVLKGGLHSTEEAFLFPTQQPGFKYWLFQDFFSVLLCLWTALRSNPSCAEQQVSQMQ